MCRRFLTAVSMLTPELCVQALAGSHVRTNARPLNANPCTWTHTDELTAKRCPSITHSITALMNIDTCSLAWATGAPHKSCICKLLTCLCKPLCSRHNTGDAAKGACRRLCGFLPSQRCTVSSAREVSELCVSSDCMRAPFVFCHDNAPLHHLLD
jgi:hypothetical protein